MVRPLVCNPSLVVFGVAGMSDFYTEMLTAVYELRWGMLAILVLVAVDFYTGLSASVQKHGGEFRFSRAGRRTMGKLMEYFCYMLVGVVLGKGAGEPLGIGTYIQWSAASLCLAALWEVDSIAGHVCDLHGIKAGFSIKRFIIYLLKKKNRSIGEAVEDALAGTDGKEDMDNGKKG